MFEHETFVLPPPRKQSQEISVSWAYPNTYAIGMAGLGFQLVWRLLDSEADTLVKRVFTDGGESGWQQCQLLGFTLAWELDFAGVLATLAEAGIPLVTGERNNTSPLIFGGGPALAANPEPLAEIFDVVLLGDAEATIPVLLEGWRQARSLPTRKEQLLFLSSLPGLYVPSLYEYEIDADSKRLLSVKPIAAEAPAQPLKRTFTAPKDYVAHSQIITPDGTWSNMFLVEVARSCPQECRFCLASYLTRPFRSSNLDTLVEKIDLGLQHTKKIGLIGPSVTEHPEFDELARRLAQRPDLEIGLPSVRMDTVDTELLSTLVLLKQKSITIAIESGSERLRTIMKKNLNQDQILQGMDLIAASGLESVKLYGIAGLPGETQDDLDETVKLLRLLKKTHKRLRFVFGLSSFVPKAQTPFQWHGRDRRCGEKMEFLRKHLAKEGIEMRLESHNWSDVQAYLSRADRRITPLLIQFAGASSKIGTWKKLWKQTPENCPPADEFIFREMGKDETLPWSHLVDGARAGMLIKQDQIALSLAAAE